MSEERERFLDMVVYQVYPRSFLDTNGDGIGDLNGVRARLDHLCELGVNAVWLCPCYKSPNYDNGYDISDYRDIMKEFGTMADWRRLIAEMHARGMRLIMDLVANHTSSQHEWFRQARSSRDNPYHGYYIWADTPPNDWESVFGGSAWEYNEPTGEYYLHSFAIQQPDLNWENPKVRKEICDVVDYWVEQGVDGFRCDVLDYIAKDFATGKMYNGPKLHEYIREIFDREQTRHLFTIGECSADERDICEICGKGRGELTTVFQFEHITMIGRVNKYLPCPFLYDEVRDVLIKWQKFSQKHELLYTLFTDNHDQPFFLSRLGNDREFRYECATMYAAMFYLLRGIPFLYQGQEYGAVNSYYDDISCFKDVETINYYNEWKEKKPRSELMKEINFGGRDNSRRPMAWNGDKARAYGFSEGTPWIAVASRADEVNLEKNKNCPKSVFRFYQALLEFRKENDCIRRGAFVDRTERRTGCFVYERRLGEEQCIVVCNFDKEQTVALPKGVVETEYVFALGNYKDTTPFSSVFRPFEVAVYLKKVKKMSIPCTR